ncbi:hypothetical protein QQ045_031675 [Rhodiola kirilowii]
MLCVIFPNQGVVHGFNSLKGVTVIHSDAKPLVDSGLQRYYQGCNPRIDRRVEWKIVTVFPNGARAYELGKDFKELLKDKPDAVKWLEKVNPEKWALSYDTGGRRWGAITTNQSESFNHVLISCRDLPITSIVHFTFKQANSYFIERRDNMLGYIKHFVPKIENLNNANLIKVGQKEVQMFDRSKGISSVLTKSKTHTHTVSMQDKTCGCGKWQLFYYSCVHALAGCAQVGLSIRDCVADEFITQAYVDTWSQSFNPQPDMTHFKAYLGPKHIPNKHFKRVKKGRHPTKRRHNEMDQRRDPRPADVPSTKDVGGRAVTTDHEVEDYAPLCEQLFGVVPLQGKRGTTVQHTWFRDHMQIVPTDASKLDIQRYARAYILLMLRSSLLPDSFSSEISLHYLPLLANLDPLSSYSWDAALLAYLYRSLCTACESKHTQLTGCAILLQLWAWEHLTIGIPRKLAIPALLPDADVDPMRQPSLGYKVVIGDPDMDLSYLDAYFTCYYTVTHNRIQPPVDTPEPYRPSGPEHYILIWMKTFNCRKLQGRLALLK